MLWGVVTKGAWPARWLARLRDRLEGAPQSRTHGVVSELFRKFPYSLLFCVFFLFETESHLASMCYEELEPSASLVLPVQLASIYWGQSLGPTEML